MKENNFKKMSLLLGLTLTTLSPAYAAKGGDSGGGGDAQEARVNEIRSDLLSWIEKEGARELVLPSDISYGDYVENMTKILENKKVALSFTYDTVKVNGVEKTCRGAFIITRKNAFSEKKSVPQILCNIPRFNETPKAEQYPLVHHEYAGLVNVEKNDGSASDYEISNQLTDFLEDRIVKKLAVKKKPEIKVEVKRDVSLELSIKKNEDEYNKEDKKLIECLPFYDQLEKDLIQRIAESEIKLIDEIIKNYYEKNGLTKVISTKLIRKSIKPGPKGLTSEITFHMLIDAGPDSVEMNFVTSVVNAHLKRRYKLVIFNYSDKLGRVENSELECKIVNSFFPEDIKYRSFIYGSSDNVYTTKLVNVETGYVVKMNDEISFKFYSIYKTKAQIVKDLPVK